jgi:ubiquinone/menaquinone biosynthesis C-methylase UbiE
MNNKLQTTGSKPIGIKGKIAGRIMNLIHSKYYRKVINKQLLPKVNKENSVTILDIGCGGGITISIFSSLLKNAKIYGIDNSVDMVSLSKKANKAGIINGKIDIVQGDVSRLPYVNNHFDIVTAFDTISFWNDIEKSLFEIKRVLKFDGIFLIVNGYPKEGTKWWNFVKFKNDNEYRLVLSKHNFKKINIQIVKNSIVICAYNS